MKSRAIKLIDGHSGEVRLVRYKEMLVRVRFSDDTCGIVDNSKIDSLIKRDEIREIKRASGWVRIGSEEARKEKEEERRTEKRMQGSLINIYV